MSTSFVTRAISIFYLLYNKYTSNSSVLHEGGRNCLWGHPKGLDFAPSSIDLSSVELELVNAMSRERILKTFLDDIRGAYDYVLIDCPPSLGMMPINTLSAADSVLIPVQAQYFSMRGLLQLIRTIDKVQRRQNPHLKIEGIVLTLLDTRTNLSRDVSAMLRDAYGTNSYIKKEIPMWILFLF